MALSARCQIGEHALDLETDLQAKPVCDGSIVVHMTDRGAPDQWSECECVCHCAPRQELIDRYNSDPKYREFLGAPLAIG